MAESHPSLGKSILIGSDQFPDNYCEPCYAANDQIKPVAGFCKDCDENLCVVCFTSHLGPKLFRNHKLVDKSTRPKTRSSTTPTKPHNLVEDCLLHHGEKIHAYCHFHAIVICKVCLTIDHEACQTEGITKLAKYAGDSQDLKNLNKKFGTLKKGFKDNQSKKRANELIIKRNHTDAINDMKKLRDEFEKLMTETEKQADIVKAEDFAKIEKVSTTCDIMTEQIDKLMTHLATMKKGNGKESLFIAIKRAENQLQSLEDKLNKLDHDNTVREYHFEPDVNLKSMLNELKVLGQLSYLQSQTISTKSDQKAKKPAHIKDITVTSTTDQEDNRIYGCLVFPNKQILITDCTNEKLKLIDINQDKILSEIQVTGNPMDVTKVKANEVAVTANDPNTIKFISVSQTSMSECREIAVGGKCRGIAYNDIDQTLIVTFVNPAKVKILDMAGTEMKCIEHDSVGGELFNAPWYVALSPDMTNIYVSDYVNNSVIFMSLKGEVKAVYTENTETLDGPMGLYVHKSGLVYVVGRCSNTVHELDPDSGEFKVVLEEKDGLDEPLSISYCEMEDKMYIGMEKRDVLKVFNMK